MYKIIIADDEKIIRSGLRNALDWQALGFEVLEVFSDGEEVIDYLEYATPDVILTDIRMENISGIEVAKYVWENHLPCKVFLVSSYQEFSYAVSALHYGVSDYLLKPVDRPSMEKTFRQLKQQLDRERAAQESAKQEKELMEGMKDILETQFLEELMMGAVPQKEFIASRFQILYPFVDVENADCFVVNARIRDFDHYIRQVWQLSYDQLEESLQATLAELRDAYLYRLVYKSQNIMSILAIRCHSGGPKESAAAHAARLIAQLEEQFSMRMEYIVQGRYANVYELVENSTGKSAFLGEWEEFHRIQSDERIHILVSNLVAGNNTKARCLCDSILDGLADAPVRQRNLQVAYMLMTICQAFSELDSVFQESLLSYVNEEDILQLPDEASVREYCHRFFDFIKVAKRSEHSSRKNLIQQAIKYVDDHILQDISREEVARSLYICPSYLGKLFAKETGENFVSYVTRMKVEKATQLLADPNLRPSQIGEQLGYATPKYFAKLFKAQTGMTLSAYRRNILCMSGGSDED